MASCKCRYCKQRLLTGSAYAVRIDNKPVYFCNIDHYNLYTKNQKATLQTNKDVDNLQSRFYSLFCEILNVNIITHTALWKEKKEINSTYPDELIIAYLSENKEWLISRIGKLNGSLYGKIRYLSTILKNNLADFKPKQETTFSLNIPAEYYVTKYKPKVRVALLDIEEECYE